MGWPTSRLQCSWVPVVSEQELASPRVLGMLARVRGVSNTPNDPA